MARDDIPGEDFMTLIMGLGEPGEPGMHGPQKTMGMPHESCCEFIAKMRDMCEEFLRTVGKDDEKEEPSEEMDGEETEEEEEE